MSDNHLLVWNAPLVLLALVLVLSAREIPVGTSQGSPSLAAALQEASDGDTIVLAAGDYSGAGNRALSIEEKRVRIEGRGEVVIDLEDSGEFLLGRRSSVELSRLRFQNASGEVVRVEDGLLSAEDCSFDSSVRLDDSSGAFQRCEFLASVENTALLATGSDSDKKSPSLTLENCLLRGSTSVETAGVAEVRLFNCTALALPGGTAVRSDGAVFLNNTISQGALAITGTLRADNSCAGEDLSACGTGNLAAGIRPGVTSDGRIPAFSPCAGAGNSDYFQETDLGGTPRSRDCVDIGARNATRETENEDETQSSNDPQHFCDLHVDHNQFPQAHFTCAEYRAFGTNDAALESAILAQVPLTGECNWAVIGADGEWVRTTAYTDSEVGRDIPDFRARLSIHPEFPDQFAGGSLCFPVYLDCVSRREDSIEVLAENHELFWTAANSRNFRCAMTGSVPGPDDYRQSTLPVPSANLPFGQETYLAVSWTGGDSLEGLRNDVEIDPLHGGMGGLALQSKRCRDCLAERSVDPLPPWATRMIRHRDFFPEPSENGPRPLPEEISSMNTSFGDRFDGDLFWDDYWQYLSPQVYSYPGLVLGAHSIVFGKNCLSVTSRPEEPHAYLNGDPASAISTQSCGSATFAYELATVGIEDLTVEEVAVAGDEGTTSPRPLLTVVPPTGSTNGTHFVVIPSEIAAGAAAGAHHVPRPPTTLRFTATSTNGNAWTTPEDHPYIGGEELSEWEASLRESWIFPRWWGKPPQSGRYQSLIPDEERSQATFTYSAQGVYPVEASCHAENWSWQPCEADPDGTTCWNVGERRWNVVVGEITATLGGQASALPILFWNDDNDSTVVWNGDGVMRDFERTAPIDYADDDLKPVVFRISSSIHDERTLLDRLLIRVTSSAGIRLYADEQKHPVGYQDSRWTSDGDSYLFRLYDAEGYAAAQDDATRRATEPRDSCRLYAEDIATGTESISVSLVSTEEPAVVTSMTETLPVQVIRVGLIPDYNRDGQIDEDDRRDACLGRVFRMWRNENSDYDLRNVLDFECPPFIIAQNINRLARFS